MPMLTTLRMRLPGVARPAPVADALGEVRHAVEHGVDSGHDVLAVDHDRGVARRAQRHVEHRAVLGDVDLLAPEHRVDAAAQTALLGKLQEQPQRLVRDAVLRVIEEEPRALGGETLSSLGIVSEELAQPEDAGFLRRALPAPARSPAA